MTDEQRRQIRQAADESYDKLRWMVGDHPGMLAELESLASASFRFGARAAQHASDFAGAEVLQSEHGSGVSASKTVRDMLVCCLSWEPDVRIIGNVRAGDAADALQNLLDGAADR